MQLESSDARVITFMGKRISIEDVDGAIESAEEAQAVMTRMADLGRADECGHWVLLLRHAQAQYGRYRHTGISHRSDTT